MDTYPVSPQWNYPFDRQINDDAVIFEYGLNSQRDDRFGSTKSRFSLQYTNKTFTEMKVVRDFWLAHRRAIAFTFAYTDEGGIAQSFTVRFDSQWKAQSQDRRYSFNVVLKEL